MPIRFPAARKLAIDLYDISIVRMIPTDVILDMAARQIMLAVSLDEQRLRNEQFVKPPPNACDDNNAT